MATRTVTETAIWAVRAYLTPAESDRLDDYEIEKMIQAWSPPNEPFTSVTARYIARLARRVLLEPR